jgi:DNA-binding CsgD family transcriptional regulator
MALQPLSREVVYTMSEAKGYDPHHVYNISGGNPFYVNEILASYSPGIPDTIKDSIISVYNTTSEATQEVWRILSVIPEGMELNRLTEIQPVWKEAIGNCLQKKILVIENDKAVFKHDLYRMAVEESLPLFQRVELNKNILDLFLTSFEEAGEIERIVHYATNAKEFNVVACYAPIAAKQAALHGSHGEAAKLYRLAIEHTDAGEIETVELYESYAYECYLTNQINEAIVYQRKALYIREEQRDHTQTGNCLRFLSRLWWFQGNSINAENYAIRAIEILKDQPDSKEKAMAYSNMAQLKMLADRSTECISWGDKAIALATALNDNETLAHALNTVGSALMTLPGSTKKGIEFLQKSLDIALKNSYHEHVARAYTALGSNAVTMKDYAFAEKHLNNGIDYCEIRNLDALRLYMIGWKSRLLLEKGNWKEAYDLANCLLQKDNLLPVIKVVALVIAGTVKMRKGDANAITLLEEAKNISFETNELQRILPALSALLEYEWINDQTLVENSLLEKVITLITASEKIVTKSKFYYWLRKRRSDQFILTAWEEKKQTTFKEEVSFWKELGCAYEQALRLSEGNDDDKRAALSIMETLGADAVCAKLKMEMRNAGIKKIPRGSRQSTKQNPAGLTVRELEILQFLKEGAQNKEIAAGLFIAPKTVDNHIAKVLFKLDVKTRMKAVQEADRLGIL